MDIEQYNKAKGYLSLRDTRLLIQAMHALPEGRAKEILAETIAEIGYDENPVIVTVGTPRCHCGMVAYDANGWSVTNNGKWICQGCSES